MKGEIVAGQKFCAPTVQCFEAGDTKLISHRKRLDSYHVAGHDEAALPLLLDPSEEFVLKFWPLILFSPVTALVLQHALKLFNLLPPVTNKLFIHTKLTTCCAVVLPSSKLHNLLL